MIPARTADIVVAGDAFIDLTSCMTLHGTLGYEPHPGGSCLNVAVGLGRLGVSTALLARISEDEFGHRLRAHLASSGVLDTHLIPATELTGLGIADVVEGKAGYSFHTASAADRGLLPEHLADLQLPAEAALHLGSIALVQEPQASTLDHLLRRESRHRLVSLDPNVRPSLVVDREAYLARLADWVALSDIVKVSDEDLAWLYPNETYESIAARWLNDGASLVLVTFGAAGAWGRTATAQGRVPAPDVDVMDTVGAGDAFMAGALAHLQQSGRLRREDVQRLDSTDLRTLLAEAAAVAAATCTRAGAQPPFREELDRTPGPVVLSPADLLDRARALATSGGRRILGITGPPGSGKTTVARELVEALGPELAVLVPMDGFHLSNRTLIAWGRRGRKGAWDTFDSDGYVQLLRRLKLPIEDVVHAPDFDRDVDESIGSAVPVPCDVPLVITEGNYLLSRRGAWAEVAELLDECWYLDIDDGTRQDRLVRRHEQHGMNHSQASAWAAGTDQNNATLVAVGRSRAQVIVTIK